MIRTDCHRRRSQEAASMPSVVVVVVFIVVVVVTWCGRDRGVVRDYGIWCGCGRDGFERQIHDKRERHESQTSPRQKLSIYTQAASLKTKTTYCCVAGYCALRHGHGRSTTDVDPTALMSNDDRHTAAKHRVRRRHVVWS